MALKFNTKKTRPEADEEEPLPKRKKKAPPVEDNNPPFDEDEDLDSPDADLDVSDDTDLEEEDDAGTDSENDDDLDAAVLDDDTEDDELDSEEDFEEEPAPKKKAKAATATVAKASSKPATKAKKEEDSPKKKSFLKTGAARAAAFQAEEAKAEMREKQFAAGKRFYIKAGDTEDHCITFLDGNLADDGSLDTPVFYEHFLMVGQKPMQFGVDTDDGPDPIVESGGREPYLCQIFTVIDHTGFADKKGNQHKHLKRLFGAKKTTIKQLNKIAAKRGGLAGLTFNVSRVGAKSPSVGDTFEIADLFGEDNYKKKSRKEIATYLSTKAYKFSEQGKKVKLSKEELLGLVSPADYDDVLVFHTPEDLIRMGLADKQETISSRKASEDLDTELDDSDFDD